MALKEIDFELSCESFVADRCNDLNLRCENLEYDVETYLVIS